MGAVSLALFLAAEATAPAVQTQMNLIRFFDLSPEGRRKAFDAMSLKDQVDIAISEPNRVHPSDSYFQLKVAKQGTGAIAELQRRICAKPPEPAEVTGALRLVGLLFFSIERRLPGPRLTRELDACLGRLEDESLGRRALLIWDAVKAGKSPLVVDPEWRAMIEKARRDRQAADAGQDAKAGQASDVADGGADAKPAPIVY